jgi:TRAP-type uncharacterized transport system substrate-binding protein
MLMPGRAACAALVALVLLGLPAAAQQVTGTIVTGSPEGTYVRIGRDLAALGAECGVSLDVRESAGSVENMEAVRDRRATQLGLVQSDVLEYFKTFAGDDAGLRRQADGIRIAFPLYDEEVHVLARRGRPRRRRRRRRRKRGLRRWRRTRRG